MVSVENKRNTRDGLYNIVDFGAGTDPSVLDTEAIQSAIDTCTGNGGGEVVIPPGAFVSGTLILKDNVSLHLRKGAILRGSRDFEDYAQIKPKHPALRTQVETRQLVFAEGASDISITGEGIIDGQGDAFPGVPGNEGITRPHLIQIINCINVRIQNVSLRNSGAWMQHYLACENLHIHGISVFNHVNRNNDGIDIDGCRNVVISDVVIDTDDDGICMKSSSAEGCESIAIHNCVISSHCNALKMGTESNTGFRNVVVSNIVVKPSRVQDRSIYGGVQGISGISLEMVDGGVLESVSIDNVTVEKTAVPLFIRLADRGRPYAESVPVETVGTLRDVTISNVLVRDTEGLGCSITGIPGYPVENISLSNIDIAFAGGGGSEEAAREVPEHEKKYPEAAMFGHLPSYGFFIRHAVNVSFSDVRLSTGEDDARPALVLDDVVSSAFSRLRLDGSDRSAANIRIRQGRDIVIDGCAVRGSSRRFVEAVGAENAGIVLKNNLLTNVGEVHGAVDGAEKTVSAAGTIQA